ncbi:zinc-ribbon domain-containing protein [Microbacterium oxydans]|uniref:zinc-ribbon domain-containing protein n=1 Tax=Microbacterium oxydans TaxID=82380 RepID=UPI000F8F8890|nr:hypothetical protein CVS53_02685 [Microbacterium oxydans]
MTIHFQPEDELRSADRMARGSDDSFSPEGRLPWRVRPYEHEEFETYYHRLLRLNHLPIIQLRASAPRIAMRYTGSSERAVQVALEHLAGLPSGYLDEVRLGDADPCGLSGCCCGDVLTKNRFRCVACSKGEHIAQRPNLSPYVCRKHHRWVGPGTMPDSQPSLQGLPQFRTAAERHARLVRERRLNAFRFRSIWAALDDNLYQATWRPSFPVPQEWTTRRSTPNPASYPAALVIYSALEDPLVLSILLHPQQSAETLERALAELVEHRTNTRATPRLVRTLRYHLRPDLYRVALATTPGWQQADASEYPVRPAAPFDRDLSRIDYSAWPTERSGIPPGYPGFDRPQSPLFIESADRDGRRFEFWFASKGRLYGDDKVSRPLATWICPAGHRLEATPIVRRSMATKYACAYCSGKVAVPGVTDFGTVHPEAVPFWDTKRNPDRNIWDVRAGTPSTAAWRCSHGHRWRQAVKTFVDNPVCRKCERARKRRADHLSKLPRLRSWWHPVNNSRINAKALTWTDSVYWICPEGHEFQATLRQMRRRKNPCRICENREIVAGINDLATVCPEIAAEFSDELNWPVTASQVAPGSRLKYWWNCGVEGHDSFRATVQSRTGRRSRCGQCAGSRVLKGVNDLATLRPEVAARWHPLLNGTLTPSDVMSRSRRHVVFQCLCGAPQPATVNSMEVNRYCPRCAARRRRPRASRP